ncbi:multiple sugar transport system substrate-binding protein [Paenibacillus castaneae]|uniref:ABC transporter substrate-binding protein n=1 Tax=Paenibacillus castaneae TaxID=474957 RepID=UPI000C9D2173|nr:extracellular solute-binding protein [Paenibacillus castaneae]NIK75353.1 multiple sugar transport system substrate-binding protein [Paenibacillus castaneae]
MKTKKALSFLLVSIMILLAACGQTNQGASGNDSSSQSPSESSKPSPAIETVEWDENGPETTVKVMYPWGEDNFKTFVLDRYEGAYPKNITLECVCIAAELKPMQEMNAKGIVPDIIFAGFGIDPLVELEMYEPLDEYVQKYGVNVDQFNKAVIATYRGMDPDKKQGLIGLPTFVDTVGLIYNKEVFDKFGVPYPTGQLTWDEVADLAVKMTAKRDGIQYRGLELGAGFTGGEALKPLQEFEINWTDPETGEVLIDKLPEVKKYFEQMKKFYSMPDLYNKDPEARGRYQFAELTVAMTVSYPAFIRWGMGGDPDKLKNIDAVPVPVWEAGGTGPNVYSHPYMLNKYSENKDAGFQVMLGFAKAENEDPVTSPRYEFATNPVYEGKNMKAFWDYNPAVPPVISKYDKLVDIEGSLKDFAESDMNIDEHLRKLKEESEVKIKEAKSLEN